VLVVGAAGEDWEGLDVTGEGATEGVAKGAEVTAGVAANGEGVDDVKGGGVEVMKGEGVGRRAAGLAGVGPFGNVAKDEDDAEGVDEVMKGDGVGAVKGEGVDGAKGGGVDTKVVDGNGEVVDGNVGAVDGNVGVVDGNGEVVDGKGEGEAAGLADGEGPKIDWEGWPNTRDLPRESGSGVVGASEVILGDILEAGVAMGMTAGMAACDVELVMEYTKSFPSELSTCMWGKACVVSLSLGRV
jgi:hypothetical protein